MSPTPETVTRLGKVADYAKGHWRQLATALIVGYAVAHGMSADAAAGKAAGLVSVIGALLGLQ